jgi:hypothetical protein
MVMYFAKMIWKARERNYEFKSKYQAVENDGKESKPTFEVSRGTFIKLKLSAFVIYFPEEMPPRPVDCRKSDIHATYDV